MRSEDVVRLYMSGTVGQKPGYKRRTSAELEKSRAAILHGLYPEEIVRFTRLLMCVKISDLEINCPICTYIIHNSWQLFR